MKVYCESKHWKVLLEEGDRGDVSLLTPPEVRTVQYGTRRDGVTNWEEDFRPVGRQSTLRVVADRDPELDARAITEHKARHPFDLYSIIETDSETESEKAMWEEIRPKPVKSSLQMVKKQMTRGRKWEIRGKGKYAKFDGIKVNLPDISHPSYDKLHLAMSGLKWDWKKKIQPKPVTDNLIEVGNDYLKNPTCVIKVIANNLINWDYADKSSLKKTGDYKFDITDEHGDKMVLDLTHYPQRGILTESMEWLQFNFEHNTDLRPVLEVGVVSQQPLPYQQGPPEEPLPEFIDLVTPESSCEILPTGSEEQRFTRLRDEFYADPDDEEDRGVTLSNVSSNTEVVISDSDSDSD